MNEIELMLARYEDVERLLADGWSLGGDGGDAAHHGVHGVLMKREIKT